jgi:hypothetical protein
LSANVAEQQLQLQAALKAKLKAAVASVKSECEALRSAKSWHKFTLKTFKPNGQQISK